MNMEQEASEEDRLWGIISWLVPLVGGIIALALKPGNKYVRHWSYLSISFFIVLVLVQIVNLIFSFIPLLGKIFTGIIDFSLLVLWIIGILRSLEKVLWKPPIVYDIAKILGL